MSAAPDLRGSVRVAVDAIAGRPTGPERPLLKVCGLRRAVDAQAARDAGAELFGVVRVAASPRCASLDDVQAVADAVGPSRVVIVVRGVPIDRVLDESARTGVDRIQLHGGYGPRDAAQLRAAGRLVLLAVPVGTSGVRDVASMPEGLTAAADAPLLVLDTAHDGTFGGAGAAFAWDAAERPERPFLVAGGVRPETLGQALRALRPDGIDLSSALESAPGIKCKERLATLGRAWRKAQEALDV